MTFFTKQKPLAEKLKESTVRQEQAAVIFAVPGIAIVKEYAQATSHEQLLAIIGSGCLYAIAIWMLVLGFRKQGSVDQSSDERGPLPWKLLGSTVASIATGLLAWIKFGPGLEVTQYMLGCFVLCLLSFGMDLQLKKRKALSGQERLDQRLNAVLIHLADADREAAKTGDRELYASFTSYQKAVRKLVEAVRASPEKAPITRRHLGPLVEGALGAGRNYLKTIQVAPNPKARCMIIELLQRLEQEYDLAARDIAAGNLESLEIEASTLTDMLNRLRPA